MTNQQAAVPDAAAENQDPPILSPYANRLWAVVAGGAAAFALVANEGFTFGRTYEQGLANGKIAEQTGSAEQAKARLVAAQERNAQLSEANANFKQANSQFLEILKAKNEQIERLAAQVGAANHCAFLHDQIRTLERETAQIDSIVLFGAPESEERQQTRRNALTQKIMGYTAQLGSCK